MHDGKEKEHLKNQHKKKTPIKGMKPHDKDQKKHTHKKRRKSKKIKKIQPKYFADDQEWNKEE